MLATDEEYFKAHQESKADSIEIRAKYFKRMAVLGLWLEMEIGITGGEEDGVENTSAALYTELEDVYDVYQVLSPTSVLQLHSVTCMAYTRPETMSLQPQLLWEHQTRLRSLVVCPRSRICYLGKSCNQLISDRCLVFHGGSGSTKEEIRTAVNNGIIEMNVNSPQE